MQGTIDDVVRAWNRKSHDAGHTRNESVWFEDHEVIYSYGSYFPLAVRMWGRNGETIVRNGDSYSASTSKHQESMLRMTGRNEPTVSFQALELAVLGDQSTFQVPFRRSMRRWWEHCKVLDNTIDRWIEDVHFNLETRKYRKYGSDNWTPPRSGRFVRTGLSTRGGEQVGAWHTLGGALFYDDRADRYLLCGLDDNSYFVSELPEPVYDVDTAFEMLKPAEVLSAEQNGTEVRRQGEWFFIRSTMKEGDLARTMNTTKTSLRKQMKQRPLPRINPLSNPHSVRWIRPNPMFDKLKHLYVMGEVRHPEHGRLSLNDPKDAVWMAVPNREVQSWSVSGGRAGFD